MSTGRMSRNKGQRGEREIIKVLQPVVIRGYVDSGIPDPEIPDLIRNLDQTAIGGYDVKGLDWLALEVKRQENITLNPWWKQTLEQCKKNQEPVLIFRKNHQPWRVMMRAALPTQGEWCIPTVIVEIDGFLDFLYKRIMSELSRV